MARPRRLNVVILPVKLWLLPERDADILQYLQNVPPRQRAAAVLQAMRGGLSTLPAPQAETDETDTLLDALGTLWD